MIRLYIDPAIDRALPKVKLTRVLWRADRLLRDYEFLKPFRGAFSAMGRPTVPMERYVRLMFLKDHEGWGYERLVAAVAASPQLRRFCRVSSADQIPHYTTLVKLTNRLGKARLLDLLLQVRRRLGLELGGGRCSA